jgi:hypothetical protein
VALVRYGFTSKRSAASTKRSWLRSYRLLPRRIKLMWDRRSRSGRHAHPHPDPVCVTSLGERLGQGVSAVASITPCRGALGLRGVESPAPTVGSLEVWTAEEALLGRP